MNDVERAETRALIAEMHWIKTELMVAWGMLSVLSTLILAALILRH